jgi:hypothetical protein
MKRRVRVGLAVAAVAALTGRRVPTFLLYLDEQQRA